MSALAENSIAEGSRGGFGFWARRVAVVLVAVLLIALLANWLRGLGKDGAAPKRQVAKISLLPDTPPPPPPPPPKEAPPPRPLDVPKPQPMEQKPAEAPPAPAERLNLEGQAGDGPSAFGAGPVSNDYKGGEVGSAASRPAAGPVGTASDRAQERFFANSARQLLRDEIERHLKSEAPQLTAVFAVWFEPDGRIRRFDLEPTGDAQADGALNAAFAETSRALKLAPPAGLPQPLRFRLTLRPLG